MAWYMYAQIPVIGAMQVEMRVHGEPLAILPSAQKVGAAARPEPAADPTHDAARAIRHHDLRSNPLRPARRVLRLLAVVLVATGLYGTLSYRVNRRTAEIGVRMAMGARRGQVVWMILRDSLSLTAIGVVAGIPLAMLVGRALSSLFTEFSHSIRLHMPWLSQALLSWLSPRVPHLQAALPASIR